MLKVVIEASDGATAASVVARAGSLREAASIAAAEYPNADVRVRFPIDPEAFFVEDTTARAGMSSLEGAGGIAAA